MKFYEFHIFLAIIVLICLFLSNASTLKNLRKHSNFSHYESKFLKTKNTVTKNIQSEIKYKIHDEL